MGHQGDAARSRPPCSSRPTWPPRRSSRRPRCRPGPTASCCPSEQPRLSYSERVPVGVVGVIAPFNFPQILAIRSVAPALALGNAVILKPDPRTAVSGGVVLARVFEEAGLPAGPAARAARRGRRRRGRGHRARGAGRLVHRLHRRRPPGRRTGRPPPQAGPPGAGRQLRADRAGRRRPGPGRLGRGLGLVPAPGPDLHDHRAAPGPGVDLRRVREPRWPTRPATCRSATRPPSRSRWARSSTRGQRDKVHGLVTATVDAGARLAAGGTYDGLFYRPTVLADVTAGDARLGQRGLRPGRPGGAVRHRRGRGQARRRQRVRSVARHLDQRRACAAWTCPARSRPGSCTSTTRPSTTSRTSRSVACSPPAPGPASAARANLDAFTETRWVTIRGDITPYPF